MDVFLKFLRVNALWSAVLVIYFTYLAWEEVVAIGGGCIREISCFSRIEEVII